MSTFTWKYDGQNTVVLNYSDFPANSSNLQLNCTDDKSDTVHNLNVIAGTSGFLSVIGIGFNGTSGEGPNFSCTFTDIGLSTVLAAQNFVFNVPFGAPITEVPYGLELADHNDLTPDGYEDMNTVLRWNNVGYIDGYYGRARAIVPVPDMQRWYDGGWTAGNWQCAFLNPNNQPL